MPITTYAELLTAVENWLVQFDVSTESDTFVDLAEDDIQNRIASYQMEEVESGTFGSDTLAKPAGFLSVEAFYLDSPTRSRTFDYVPPDRFFETPERSWSGLPRIYTVIGDDFRIAPTPTGYDYILHYRKKLTALSDANPSNWVLADHPTLYLYGALSHAAEYLQMYDVGERWRNRFDAKLMEVNKLEQRKYRPGGQMRSSSFQSRYEGRRY